MTAQSTRTPRVQPNYFYILALTGATCLIASSICLNILSAIARGGSPTEQGAWIATAIAADLIKATCPLVAFAALGVGIVRRASAVLRARP